MDKQPCIETGSLSYSAPGYPYQYGNPEEFVRCGYTREQIVEHDTRRTLRDVAKEIEARIAADSELKEFGFEWFGPVFQKEGQKWADDCQIVVIAEQGGSEGWMVKVGAIRRESNPAARATYDIWLHGKMFQREYLWIVAEKISVWLGLT